MAGDALLSGHLAGEKQVRHFTLHSITYSEFGNFDMNKTNPMLLLADRYSEELTAQFRTLNFFAEHAGEIGRAHETYLRDMIGRFFTG